MSDLATLFQEDPLRLTREDILEKMVPEFRRQRAMFNLNGEAAKPAKPTKTPPGTKIDLSALGLLVKK